jgi:hypothetical protein
LGNNIQKEEVVKNPEAVLDVLEFHERYNNNEDPAKKGYVVPSPFSSFLPFLLIMRPLLR